MQTLPPASRQIVPARYRVSTNGDEVGRPFLRPTPIGRDRCALTQSWVPDGPEPQFQPGWVEIGWNESFLYCDAVLVGTGVANAARKLNERTWELGDVFEVFLQVPPRSDYVEFHVTPENQRLQLGWTSDGLKLVRSGALSLENFLLPQTDSIESATSIASDHWAIRVAIPARAIGIDAYIAGMPLRAAFCRYDCGTKPEPVFSSTAPLTHCSFHRCEEWQDLALLP